VIDGLWGLAFGNGGKAGRPGTLYFTAGPNGEGNGLFGALDPVPEHKPDGDHDGDRTTTMMGTVAMAVTATARPTGRGVQSEAVRRHINSEASVSKSQRAFAIR